MTVEGRREEINPNKGNISKSLGAAITCMYRKHKQLFLEHEGWHHGQGGAQSVGLCELERPQILFPAEIKG